MNRAAPTVALAAAMLTLGGGGAPAQAVAPSNPSCDPGRPAIAYHPGGALIGTSPAPALVPCRYDTGAVAMEPSFVFARDGRILYQTWMVRTGAVGGLPPISGVVRSNRDATRWEDVSPAGVNVHITSLDPFIHEDHRTGRIFTVDFIATAVPLCASISYTDDAGDHWTTTHVACGGFDGESIGAGPPVSSPTIGYPDIVYYCTGTTLGSSPPTSTPLCSKSLDGGLTFTPTGLPPYPLVGAQDTFAPWAGNPVVGPDGTVYLPKRYGGQPELAISHDEGRTWTQAVVAHNGASGEATRATVDASGGLYYTWTGDDHKPYLAASRDGGATWSAPLLLSPPGLREAALPRVAVERPGRVAVVYLGSTNAPGKPPWYGNCNVFLTSCTDGPYASATWNGYISQIDDLFAPAPVVRTLLANDPSRPLFTGGCSADAACKAVLDFLDVNFDADGTVWGAFVDDCQLKRDIIPVFNASAGVCEDGVGEGILVRMTPATAAVAASGSAAPRPGSVPNTSSPGGGAAPAVVALLAIGAGAVRRRRRTVSGCG